MDSVDTMIAEGDDGGPLINGRAAMTVAQVQQWCKKARAPVLSDDAAAEIARFLNEALFLGAFWKPEFAAARRANPSTKRMERIARALAILRDDLPEALAESRKIGPDADHSATESLLDLVTRHTAIIDKFGPVRPGRQHSLANNVEANLTRKMIELWGDESRTRKKSISNLVSWGMEWLREKPRTYEAASRNRRRRT